MEGMILKWPMSRPSRSSCSVSRVSSRSTDLGVVGLGQADAVGQRRQHLPQVVGGVRGVQRVDAHEHLLVALLVGAQEVPGQQPGGVLLRQRHRVLQVDHDAVGLEHRDVLQHARHVARHVEHGAAQYHGLGSSMKMVSTPLVAEWWRSMPSTRYSARTISQVANTSASTSRPPTTSPLDLEASR